jgi:hypothetical protein
LKNDESGNLKLHYERLEFDEKLGRMGLTLPW